jgi:hypothetical protein
MERDARPALAEADELGIRAGSRREPLRAHVQGFQKVRLAGAVRTHDEHEPGLEAELEACVRAVVAERDLGDDQPGSLIGMSRYV